MISMSVRDQYVRDTLAAELFDEGVDVFGVHGAGVNNRHLFMTHHISTRAPKRQWTGVIGSDSPKTRCYCFQFTDRTVIVCRKLESIVHGLSMSNIQFTKEEKAALVKEIQAYFKEELDQTIGQFPATFLLDFFTETVGPHYYNRALQDAQLVLEDRMDSLRDALYAIEKPSSFTR